LEFLRSTISHISLTVSLAIENWKRSVLKKVRLNVKNPLKANQKVTSWQSSRVVYFYLFFLKAYFFGGFVCWFTQRNDVVIVGLFRLPANTNFRKHALREAFLVGPSFKRNINGAKLLSC